MLRISNAAIVPVVSCLLCMPVARSIRRSTRGWLRLVFSQGLRATVVLLSVQHTDTQATLKQSIVWRLFLELEGASDFETAAIGKVSKLLSS